MRCWFNQSLIPALALASFAVPALAQEVPEDIPAAQEQPQEQRGASTEQAAFEERYASVMENNIFMRDRRPPREDPRPPAPPPPAPPPPETNWLLTGVVFEEGVFRAYFENLRTREVLKVASGGAVAEGIIDELYIDSVSYLADGEIVWVDIGDDLTGNPATLPASSRTVRQSEPTPSTPADPRSNGRPAPSERPAEANGNGASPNAEENSAQPSIVERLRQRRMREQSGN